MNSPYLPKLHRFLVLTPDGIGSTFFQRLLTYYLLDVGIPTKNWHDLMNHYDDDLLAIVKSLASSQKSTIARLSPYRLIASESEDLFFDMLRHFFTRIFVVKRCSFESILSYSSTHINQNARLNVYSKDQYNNLHNAESFSISEESFVTNIKYFLEFYDWVNTNFPSAEYVNYEDLVFNTNKTLKTLFGYDHSLNFELYNKFLYRYVRGLDTSSFSSSDVFKVSDFIASNSINIDHPFRTFPIKKVTLKEKISSISNLSECLDIYNNYPSNSLQKVSKKELVDRLEHEERFFNEL